MNRYYMNIALLCILISPMLSMPKLLIVDRYRGSLSSILIAMILGAMLSGICLSSLRRLKGVNMTEIMERYLPKVIKFPLYLMLSMMWFTGGIITLFTLTFISVRFINPYSDIRIILVCFILVSCWASLRHKEGMMNGLEILLCLCAPFIIVLLSKGFSLTHFQWDAVLSLNDYVMKWPKLHLIAVSLFMFTGHISLFIWSGSKNDNNTMYWFIPLTASIAIFSLIVIPLGMHGTIAPDHYTFLWSSTADSIQFNYSLVERGLYVYLAVYMLLSLLFISVCWHVATHWLSQILPEKKRSKLIQIIVLSILSIGVIFLSYSTNEKRILVLASHWFVLHFILVIIVIIILMLVGRKRENGQMD